MVHKIEDLVGMSARTPMFNKRANRRGLAISIESLVGTQTSLSEDEAVALYLRQHPGFLQCFLEENTDLLKTILPSSSEHRDGGNVVDLRDFMIDRQRLETTHLRDKLCELVETSRSNMTAQSRAHSAVLSLLAVRNFEELIEVVAEDLAVILDVDVVTLCVESDKEVIPHSQWPGVLIVEPGFVDTMIGVHQDFHLSAGIVGDPILFGHGAGLVRSQALIRLSVNPHASLAMLSLGSRRETQFEQGQGTELLGFLGAVLELSIRAWLEG